MAAKHQKFKVKIDNRYSSDERELIAQEVIDFVIKRSKKGKDKNNKAFVPYSKSYKKSLDFKIAGKSSKVNLTLSDEMLNLLDLLDDRPGSLTIGYEAGSNENAKADGNVRGTYGKQRGSSKKARDFMGIADSDLNKILNKFPEPGDETGFTELAAIAEAARSDDG